MINIYGANIVLYQAIPSKKRSFPYDSRVILGMFGKIVDCMLSHDTLGCLPGFDFQADALPLVCLVKN